MSTRDRHIKHSCILCIKHNTVPETFMAFAIMLQAGVKKPMLPAPSYHPPLLVASLKFLYQENKTRTLQLHRNITQM